MDARPNKESALKNLLIAVALLLAAVPAVQAGPREDSLAGIMHCGEQSEDRAWLDCVYGAVQPVRAKLGLPPAPAFQQKLVSGGDRPLPASPMPTMPAAQAPAMSAARPAATAAAPPQFSDGRWVPLKTYTFDRHGIFTATLADGPVWRQDDADVNYAHWKGPAPQYLVSVAGGLFGSATLEVRNDGNEYRVRRIR